ncbi:MAG: hypothetical protein DWQ02_06715 [Bacteroidetes bacterium]|nr:MAG: hypothetical protein DWQ02_06715 [Bacteroidota bacterium]
MSTSTKSNINLHLYFNGDQISSQLLVDSLKMIEKALHRSDIEDVVEAVNQLPLHKDVAKIIQKRALKELENHNGRRIGFHKANNGSIILIGAVSAVGYFIVKDILLDLFKDSLKGSELYKSLKDYFSTVIDQKNSRLIGLIKKETKKLKEKGKVNQEYTEDSPNHDITITMEETFYQDDNSFSSWDLIRNDKLK